jgi:YidC/Oxa1 family membrane protein insertase
MNPAGIATLRVAMPGEFHMAEMKNPNQKIGGQGLRAAICMALIAIVVMFVQQGPMHKAGSESFNSPIGVVQPGGGTVKAKLQAGIQPMAKPNSFLDVLARPLFLALNLIHLHVVSNWGWAILLLSVLINVVLLPLRIKMMRSQSKMQRMQPEMAAIRERFKGVKLGDPRMQAMHQEIAGLQRAHGVSMFSGILPLLIQMPFLYAFYRMLHNAAELNHAPWLWLHDLSSADPLNILPIVFVGTMILQQVVTPNVGVDPAQRRLMAVAMPLFSGVMTWHVSAGLALYWSCGNVFAIVQQVIFSQAARRSNGTAGEGGA